jgi:Tetratricopeptide repeat
MIETLIEAERALTHGLVDQAERLYRQVADKDPKSSIAVMGLARVALERGDDRTAYLHGRAALAIDPDNPAAQHLVMRLAEVMAGRGETLPDVSGVASVPPAVGESPQTPAPPPTPSTPHNQPETARSPRPPRTRSQGLVGRLLRLLRRKPRSR